MAGRTAARLLRAGTGPYCGLPAFASTPALLSASLLPAAYSHILNQSLVPRSVSQDAALPGTKRSQRVNFWSSSRRIARELFPEQDTVLDTGAAELPAGLVSGADTETSHHSTGCKVKRGLWGRLGAQGVYTAGGRKNIRKGASRLERLAEGKAVEPSSKQRKHERSQDTQQRTGR